MADVVRAFAQSPCYRRGALFVVYDEWGGFFDHVRPPRVRDARASRDLDEDFGQMGFRIPAVAVSPFARRRAGRGVRVRHAQLGFESILKLISYRFGLGHLTVRDRYATNIGETFDWARPRSSCPTCPTRSTWRRGRARSAAATCSRRRARPPTSATSPSWRAWPTASAFRSASGKVDELFTSPDAIRRAVRSGTLPVSGL